MEIPTDHIVKKLIDAKIKNIDLGYSKYSIELVKDLKVEGEKVWGYVDPDKRVIHLELNMDYETSRATLLHECLHILVKLTGISYFNKEEKLVLGEEQLVRQLEKALLLAGNLNPKFMKIILNV